MITRTAAAVVVAAGVMVGGSGASTAEVAPEQTRAQAEAQVDAAASSCAGSRVGLLRHRSYSGNHVANTGVYRSGNDWCAVTVKVGSIYGERTRMSLRLAARDGRSRTDDGMYLYQAGPVRISNARCVYTDVAMWRNGSEILQDYSYGGFGSCPQP